MVSGNSYPNASMQTFLYNISIHPKGSFPTQPKTESKAKSAELSISTTAYEVAGMPRS
jgi:hypothetical protein